MPSRRRAAVFIEPGRRALAAPGSLVVRVQAPRASSGERPARAGALGGQEPVGGCGSLAAWSGGGRAARAGALGGHEPVGRRGSLEAWSGGGRAARAGAFGGHEPVGRRGSLAAWSAVGPGREREAIERARCRLAHERGGVLRAAMTP